jgi:hypothetical protein
MEEKVTPAAFYGSAIAALCGLLFGLLFHAPWQNHAGGPQILFASAAAAELARAPSVDDDNAAPPSEDQEITKGDRQLAALDETYNDPGYIPPDPLPVTRLAPERFGPDPADVKEASVEETAELDGGDQAADTAKASTVSDFN